MVEKKHVKFSGSVVIVGFGSVAQGALPLLLRHIDMPRERISIITGDDRGHAEAAHYGISYSIKPLTRENYRALLEPLLGKGDFLINLSVDVASVALAQWWRNALIGVSAQPGFDAGVQIQHAFFAAPLRECDARHIHRQVDQKIALVEQGFE